VNYTKHAIHLYHEIETKMQRYFLYEKHLELKKINNENLLSEEVENF